MLKRSLALLVFVAGCGLETSNSSVKDDPVVGPSLESAAAKGQIARGRDIWLKSTFGSEIMFSGLFPHPPFNITIGFDVMLTSPRDTRFRDFGVINDPDCTAGDASTGFYDRCPDPTATGVVGFRQSFVAGQRLVGFSCAGCHAGLDPANPPADPNHPKWSNIHLSAGNQYIDLGKVFSGHLSPADPRWQVFHSWAPGTVDTTLVETDHINNPGIITQFWNFPDRPYFNLTHEGSPIRVHRAGQGGEDDAGCEAAALRVYFNIGMCTQECVIPHLANGPGGSQTPIDDAECSAKCPTYVAAKAAVVDECAFIQSTKPPALLLAPSGYRFVDWRSVLRGYQVFQNSCASCHSNGKPLLKDILSDDEIHPMAEIGTNSCRARTTNWTEGHIWEQFSSDQYKSRSTGGPGFYRDVPLRGLWATAPFLHNNRIGLFNGDPSVAGRIAAYEDAMDQLLNPSKRTAFVEVTTVPVQIPAGGGTVTLPAGTPVGAFANVDPATGTNLCPDFVENEGHTFGQSLSSADKHALTEYLKTQ